MNGMIITARISAAVRIPVPKGGRLHFGMGVTEKNSPVTFRIVADSNELYSKTYAVVAMPGVENFPPNYPKAAEKLMIKNDFVWMAENREKILTEWTKRYESKSAPKN